jgi:hypothetical protein
LGLPLTQGDLRQDHVSISTKPSTELSTIHLIQLLRLLLLQAAAQCCAKPCFALLQGNL